MSLEAFEKKTELNDSHLYQLPNIEISSYSLLLAILRISLTPQAKTDLVRKTEPSPQRGQGEVGLCPYSGLQAKHGSYHLSRRRSTI